jgi:spore germination protein KA
MPNSKRNSKSAKEVIFEETFDYNNLELNFQNIQSILGSNSDFVFRQIFIRNKRSIETNVIYMDGMINNQLISDYVIKPMMEAPQFDSCETEQDAINAIEAGTIYYSNAKKRTNITDVMSDVLSGSVAVIFNKHNMAFTFETKGFDKRNIEKPSVENVIKGAKDSFVETIRSNTATCRRKIKSPNLMIEETVVGKESETSVAVCYMKNIADGNLVQKVKDRLNNINVDNLITAGYLEEFITDLKSSAFPQIQYTERPDRLCTSILDGRVGLIIDGLPVTYIVPGTLLQFLQAPEDYSQHFLVSSAIRYLRFTSMFITLLLPAFFVSIVNFHQEMIPTELTFSIIAAKQGVPFPFFVETIAMLLAFEVLIEAGLRLPQTIGQTVSIVGALVVGQAAVQAKLISPVTVIIVAITAITSFTMPNQDFSNALRIWRFGFTIAAGIIGMYGLSMGLAVLLHHWCRIDSFGVPYLSPFVGGEETQLKDTLFRFPLSTMNHRPAQLRVQNKHRID